MAKERSVALNVILAFLIVFLVVASILSYAYMKSRRAYEHLQYEENLRQYESEQEKLSLLIASHNASYARQIAEKTALINDLQVKMAQYKERRQKINRISLDERLLNSDIYRVFKGYSDKPVAKPNAQEWKELRHMMNREYPQFYAHLFSKCEWTDTEYEICILVRLFFKPSDIANFYGYDRSYITKVRKQMHKKIFGKEGKGKDFDDYIRNIV